MHGVNVMCQLVTCTFHSIFFNVSCNYSVIDFEWKLTVVCLASVLANRSLEMHTQWTGGHAPCSGNHQAIARAGLFRRNGQIANSGKINELSFYGLQLHLQTVLFEAITDV